MIFKRKKKRIFLDYASSTPVASEVLRGMAPWQDQNFANPSALYSEALLAKKAVEESRDVIASILHAQPKEIIFTGGGTESNNLSLLGAISFAMKNARDEKYVPHVVTTEIEHPAILEVCKEIERRGGEVTYIPVGQDGIVNPRDVVTALGQNTVLVSVMYANNEIGTIQPIAEIAKGIKSHRERYGTQYPYLHTDACQAVLYESLHVLKLGVDMMTCDGIKMYGPRGLGILYVKNGVGIEPSVFGGGQEGGLRSGTEHVAGIVGLAKAFEVAEKIKNDEVVRLTKIRDHGIEKILEKFPDARLNGSPESRLPNNINVCFKNLDAEFAVVSLDVVGISASYSSSCRTLKEDSSSYVVEALGRPECRNSSLRFTLGRETTQGDIDTLVEVLEKIVK